ncbi:MAG: tetratricopeptide repeat protein [Nitrospinota bacterium]
MVKKGSPGKDKLVFLVVHNRAVQRAKLIEMLSAMGFKNFEKASDGAVAFNILKRRTIDFIISGWDMPQMNGLALLKVVSADELLYRIPFIIIAQTIDKEMVVEAGKRGVAAILVDPVSPAELEAKVAGIFEQPVDDETEMFEDMFSDAKKLTEQGNYDKALAVYKKMLQLHESAEVYYNIGYIKTSQGKHNEAIIAFRKAVMINNLHAMAYKSMAEVYLKKDDPHEAEKCFEKAGDIFLARNMDNEAEAAFNKVLELNPNTVNVYNSLGIIYRKQNKYDKAIDAYEAALKVDPEDENIYYNLGRAMLENKQIKKAKKAFERALAIDPSFDEARRMLQAIDVGF